MKRKWQQVNNHFFDEREQAYYIDAWKTNNPEEEGRVIAKVFKDKVVYFNENAKVDFVVQECISECKEEFLRMIDSETKVILFNSPQQLNLFY